MAPAEVSMMTWSYRAVRREVDGGAEVLLAEVYLDRAGTIGGWCWASAPIGEDRFELLLDLEHMGKAARQPIIPATELPGYEREEPK